MLDTALHFHGEVCFFTLQRKNNAAHVKLPLRSEEGIRRAEALKIQIQRPLSTGGIVQGAGRRHGGAANTSAGRRESDDLAGIIPQLQPGGAPGVLGIDAEDLPVDQVRLLEFADGPLVVDRVHVRRLHKIGQLTPLRQRTALHDKGIAGHQHIDAGRLQRRHGALQLGEGVYLQFVGVLDVERRHNPIQIILVTVQ